MKNNDKVSTISSSSDDEYINIKVENKKKINKKNIIKDNEFQKEIKVIGKKRKITLIDI